MSDNKQNRIHGYDLDKWGGSRPGAGRPSIFKNGYDMGRLTLILPQEALNQLKEAYTNDQLKLHMMKLLDNKETYLK